MTEEKRKEYHDLIIMHLLSQKTEINRLYLTNYTRNCNSHPTIVLVFGKSLVHSIKCL